MNYDALTYLILTFGGCLGIYQIAAAAADLKGLRFLSGTVYSYVIGFAILGATYGWFFTCADLNMNADGAAVVEGHEQLELFLLGAFISLIVTFLISSLTGLRHSKSTDSQPVGEGIEDLKNKTFFQAWAYRMKERGRGR